jgi:hypothetical protein
VPEGAGGGGGEMIFRQWHQVLGGLKTQTRRLVKEGDYVWCYPFKSLGCDGVLERRIEMVVAANRRLRWEVGKTYAVQPERGKKSMGRVKLLSIRRERLQDISGEDAIAEGCGAEGLSVPAEKCIALRTFRELWRSIYPSNQSKRGDRWQDNPEVWVLEMECVQDLRGEVR